MVNICLLSHNFYFIYFSRWILYTIKPKIWEGTKSHFKATEEQWLSQQEYKELGLQTKGRNGNKWPGLESLSSLVFFFYTLDILAFPVIGNIALLQCYESLSWTFFFYKQTFVLWFVLWKACFFLQIFGREYFSVPVCKFRRNCYYRICLRYAIFCLELNEETECQSVLWNSHQKWWVQRHFFIQGMSLIMLFYTAFKMFKNWLTSS